MKTEYIVESRQTRKHRWVWSFDSEDKELAERAYNADLKRFPNWQHRLIRQTVLKESK